MKSCSSVIKIFVDAHVFDGVPQGTVTFLAGIYRELLKNKRLDIYFGSNNRNNVVELLKTNEFNHICYSTHSKFNRLLYVIPKILKQYEIYFAHFQYITPLFKPCKYVVTTHDLLFLSSPHDFPLGFRIKNSILFYLSAKRSDIVTTVSHYSKDSIHKYFNIPQSKILITTNAVNVLNIEGNPLAKLQNRKFILFVSRIEPRKNQTLLIKVWKEMGLIEQGYDLVLVGAEGMKDFEFKKQLQLLNNTEKEHFHWLIKLPEENLVWLYKQCSLFIFPSSSEGFGIPPLEAALYGAKVLCSNTTAMKEFSFFDKYLFSPSNLEELKFKIQNTLANEYPHEYIISEIRKNYSWENSALEFANALFRAVDGT